MDFHAHGPHSASTSWAQSCLPITLSRLTRSARGCCCCCPFPFCASHSSRTASDGLARAEKKWANRSSLSPADSARQSFCPGNGESSMEQSRCLDDGESLRSGVDEEDECMGDGLLRSPPPPLPPLEVVPVRGEIL